MPNKKTPARVLLSAIFMAAMIVNVARAGAREEGRLLPDEVWSQYLHVTEERQPDGTWNKVVTPALDALGANLFGLRGQIGLRRSACSSQEKKAKG